MMNEYLEIGKIVNTHGVMGEIKVYPLCDDPEMICEIDRLFIEKNNQKQEIEVQYAKLHKNMILMKLSGIDNMDSATALKETILYAHRNDFNLDKDTYFIVDLMGLLVIDTDDNSIVYGKIIDITQTGANDVYHIKNDDGKLYLVPAIAPVVIKTDIKNGVMEIRPLKGLFE